MCPRHTGDVAGSLVGLPPRFPPRRQAAVVLSASQRRGGPLHAVHEEDANRWPRWVRLLRWPVAVFVEGGEWRCCLTTGTARVRGHEESWTLTHAWGDPRRCPKLGEPSRSPETAYRPPPSRSPTPPPPFSFYHHRPPHPLSLSIYTYIQYIHIYIYIGIDRYRDSKYRYRYRYR